MDPISIHDMLAHLVDRYDLPFLIEDEWVLPYGKLPAMQAVWHPRAQSGRLDVNVLLEDHRMIQESFVGWGPGEQGLQSAVQSFCENSLHPCLAAFWLVTDQEQVTIEPWTINGQHYTAYLGNLGYRRNSASAPPLPDDIAAAFEHAIKQDTLDYAPTWYRFFFCNSDGEFTFEALKNNEPWEPGRDALQALPWQPAPNYYSLRSFMLLLPARTPSA